MLNFDTPNQTDVTDSQGKISTYTTTLEGGVARVLRIDGPGCDSCGRGDVEYAYNDQYQLTQFKKKDGSSTDYAYDDKGRTTGITQHNPNNAQQTPTTLSYEYAGRLQPSAIVKASMNPTATHRTELTYNAQGQPTELTEKGYRPSTGKTHGGFEPIARTTTLAYNAHGDLIAIDGPRTEVNDTLTLTYDDKHRLKTLTTPDGIVQQVLAYDKLGRPTQLKKGTQTPTTLSYTARGQISEVAQGQNKVSYAYDPTGNLISLTGPDGDTLTLDYDAAGRATQLTGPNGEQLNTELDTEGRLTRRQLLNTNGNVLATVSYLYDAQGRLQSATQNGTDVTRYDYNAQGQLTQVQNPDGHATELSYNGIGQLLSLTQPGNVTTQLTYTPNGQANGIIDARNNATTYTTDDFGNRITQTSADTGTQSYAYDQAGNRIKQTDAEGHTTTYTYDAANRLIEEHNSAGKTRLSYHTNNGLLETITDATSTETFKYNVEGQLTAQTREIDGHRFTTGYAYHAQSQKLTQKTLPDGQTLNYHYYEDSKQKGHLRAITTPSFLGLTQKVLIGEIDDDKTNGTTRLTYGNGTKTITRYNAAGQVLAIENTQALALQYHYDEHGQITGIDLNGSLQTYQYDQLGRLTHADTLLGDYRYDYDAVGNRTEKQHTDTRGATNTETYSYAKEGEGNRLVGKGDPTEKQSKAYAYNTSGSPVQAGELSYDYNRQQRPVKVYKTASDSTNSRTKTLIAEYVYNRFGERIKKVVYSNTKKPKITYYLYDGHSLTAEANESGKITAQYLYFKNQPFTKLEGKTVYALHTDNLGTPRAATDNKGKTVWQADYSPFGKAQITTQQITLNLRFPGQYEDAETGKYYNYLRTYDPDTGRYATSDPIGLAGGINTYAYVDNNPLSKTDVLGLKPTAQLPGGGWQLTSNQYLQLATLVSQLRRTEYYIKLYEFTGSQLAIEMAQISSNSGFLGGVAWKANDDIEAAYPSLYPKDVREFSIEIFTNDFTQIKQTACTLDKKPIYWLPSDLDMLVSTVAVWGRHNLGHVAPPRLRLNLQKYWTPLAGLLSGKATDFVVNAIQSETFGTKTGIYESQFRQDHNHNVTVSYTADGKYKILKADKITDPNHPRFNEYNRVSPSLTQDIIIIPVQQNTTIPISP